MISEKKVISIIQSVLGAENKINLKSSSNNTEDWDSLAHLNILEKLDKVSKGKAGNIAELATAGSVKKILSILKKKKLLSK